MIYDCPAIEALRVFASALADVVVLSVAHRSWIRALPPRQRLFLAPPRTAILESRAASIKRPMRGTQREKHAKDVILEVTGEGEELRCLPHWARHVVRRDSRTRR